MSLPFDLDLCALSWTCLSLRHWGRLWIDSLKLKETKTHISKYFYYKVFIIENNQWKFEQNQANNKEVTALWNLAISRGRYSKWWQVVDNSPYDLYMKFHVFPLFWWLRQFPSLKSRYDKQGCILHGILWSRAMETHVSKENLKRIKFCVQNEWRVVHNTVPIIWLPPFTVH